MTFLGHTISNKGIAPDARKIKTIIDMPEPNNKKESHRFLGMITYLRNFLPNLSAKMPPLRLLLEKGTIWSFDKPQRDALLYLKAMITQSPKLKYFNTKLPKYHQIHRHKDSEPCWNRTTKRGIQ